MSMHPRLKTSKKWSPLPKEFLKQVEGVFKQTFKPQIGTGKIVVEAGESPQMVTAEIEMDLVEEVRTRIPVFDDRRSDVY